jgi:FkbM family methyltransferase
MDTPNPALEAYERSIELLRKNLGPLLDPGFFFVNIGASDGIVADPIYPFFATHHPVGIAVEPVPYVMERLKENYREFPGIIFEQVAISETDRSFWFVDENSGSIEYVMQSLGSMSRDRVLESIAGLRTMEEHISRSPAVPASAPEEARGAIHEGVVVQGDVEDHVRRLDIECVRFQDLIARNGVERIDFLNVDVEGFDDEVFWSVDWDRFRPTVVCLELVGFPAEDVAAIEAKLFGMGYRAVQNFGLFSTVYATSTPSP